MSHEGPAFVQRTLIYAAHLAAGDPFPIWSSVDNFGFGSPMPLFYHKLFYLLAAPLQWILESPPLAVATGLALVLSVGALGMYRLMRELGASELPATLAGVCLIVANYTVTNWLVRGNVAECTAAMLVPRFLGSLQRGFRTAQWSASLGLWLGLIWLAHSIIAFYLALIAAAVVLAMFAGRQISAQLLTPRQLWRPLLVFVAMVTPYLVAMRAIGVDYDLSRMLTPPFRPEDQMRPLLWYFWDTHWRFGPTSSGLTLQLDLPMLALVGVGVGALVAYGRAMIHELRATIPLVTICAIVLFLQARVSLPVYHFVPGMLYIQFPWRLLAVITPALIALAWYVADRGLTGQWRPFVFGCAAAWMAAASGAFVDVRDARIDLSSPALGTSSFSGFREYEPQAALSRMQLEASIRDAWTQAGCTFERNPPPGVEAATVAFRTTCPHATTLPLPLYATALHRVTTNRYARLDRCVSLPMFPGVCGVTVPTGTDTIDVSMPTWRRLLLR